MIYFLLVQLSNCRFVLKLVKDLLEDGKFTFCINLISVEAAENNSLKKRLSVCRILDVVLILCREGLHFFFLHTNHVRGTQETRSRTKI